MLHELTVCLGSSYWLNISFCWDKPEWQRREETPPLIIPPSLFCSSHYPSPCSSAILFSILPSLHPVIPFCISSYSYVCSSIHYPSFPLNSSLLHSSPTPSLPHPCFAHPYCRSFVPSSFLHHHPPALLLLPLPVCSAVLTNLTIHLSVIVSNCICLSFSSFIFFISSLSQRSGQTTAALTVRVAACGHVSRCSS